MDLAKPQLTEYHVMLFNALTLTMLAESATIDVYKYINDIQEREIAIELSQVQYQGLNEQALKILRKNILKKKDKTTVANSCKLLLNNARVNLTKASEQQTRDLSIRSFDVVNAMLHKVPEIYNALILLTDEQKTVIANNVAKFTKLNRERLDD